MVFWYGGWDLAEDRVVDTTAKSIRHMMTYTICMLVLLRSIDEGNPLKESRWMGSPVLIKNKEFFGVVLYR